MKPRHKRRSWSVFVMGCRAFFLFSLLTGCATDGKQKPLSSSRAVSTESSKAIQETLASELTPVEEKKRGAIPDFVHQALIPDYVPDRTVSREDERFDLSVEDAPAARFFRDLVRDTGYNVLVYPDVKARISVELTQVTVPEVVQMVCETYGLMYERKNNLFKVMSGGLRSEVFQINYLDVTRRGDSNTTVNSGQVSSVNNTGSSSDGTSGGGVSSSVSTGGTNIVTSSSLDFWSDLREMLTSIVGNEGGRNVVANPYSGIIVVRAMPDELEMVREVLERADLIMQRQVILEAKILEVQLSEGYEQGIQWSAISRIGRNKNPDGSQESYFSNGLTARQVTNTPLDGVFSATLKIDDFTSVIELLGTQGNVQVLSSPRISTVNNQKAVIKVGTDEFFVTDIDVSDTTSSTSTTGSSSTDIQLTPFFSGISLDVTPQISDDGGIILHVHPSISEVEDQQKVVSLGEQTLTLPLALSTIRETDSVISAENGQIVVIGGLIQNINKENNATTPILGDIPLLGEVFKQKSQAGTKSELVILIKPVITTRSGFRDDLERTRGRMKTLDEMLSSPPEPKLW